MGGTTSVEAPPTTQLPSPSEISQEECVKMRELLRLLNAAQQSNSMRQPIYTGGTPPVYTPDGVRWSGSTGVGPSVIPRLQHQDLGALYRYLEQNDIWLQRRGENFVVRFRR